MDNFEILEKLGDGAYSVVYKVKRKQDSQTYALKKVKLQNLNEKEKQNALNEIRILASIKSPFVISYKEAFIEDSDSSLCLVMEFADKGDLFQKITEFKKIGCLFEEIDIWRIFIQMTRGLKALHDKKILHRDLKSANIFLESDGSAKIGDLNVSKVAKKGLGYTQTGTPYYASPEVWKDNPYDYKSDIWSLGCVTYEMCMLHPPFRAKNMEALYNKVIKGEYGKISDKYSNDLNEVIKMLLKVNSSERPSCGQILKCSIVKKRLEFFQAQCGFEGDVMDEGELLKTIRIPKNILFLSEKLPGANYTLDEKKKNTFPSNNLPSIKGKIGSHRDGIFQKKMLITNIDDNKKDKDKEEKEKLIEEGKRRTKSREGNENKSNNVIIFERSHNRNSKSPGNSYNYIYNFSINNNNNNNINIHSNNIQKKIQQPKKSKPHKYNIEELGLSDIYKIYSPTLDINYGHKVNKRSYEHYIYHNKKHSNNYNNNEYIGPKIIPNRRLNPINTRQIIRNFKL